MKPALTGVSAGKAGSRSASAALTLTQAQGNLVMAALAECPFKLVYELIGKLNHEANGNAPGTGYRYHLDASELKLILGALGNLPYHQVHATIDELQQQWLAGIAAAAAVSTPRKRKGTR